MSSAVSIASQPIVKLKYIKQETDRKRMKRKGNQTLGRVLSHRLRTF